MFVPPPMFSAAPVAMVLILPLMVALLPTSGMPSLSLSPYTLMVEAAFQMMLWATLMFVASNRNPPLALA